MLTKLRMHHFKSFDQAELTLGPFSVLVGTNASGKSNVRDALRFLHGIGRGYSLADIIGGKYGEGGYQQWRGIRGGPRELAFRGAETFTLELELAFDHYGSPSTAYYSVEINPGFDSIGPYIISERLADSDGFIVFEITPAALQTNKQIRHVRIAQNPPGQQHITISDQPLTPRQIEQMSEVAEFRRVQLLGQHPILSQFTHPDSVNSPYLQAEQRAFAQKVVNTLTGIRFLDLNPDAMRWPSVPGQNILGDQGENLSSVLQNIYQDPQRRHALTQWVQALTPIDVRDFAFPTDLSGQVLVELVEGNGQHTSANSASDGTLRFLAMLAALLGDEPAGLYFFEELDNGIHPTRLHLLIQLIEQQVNQGVTQVVTTTHSPQLLRLLSPTTMENASVTYRLEQAADTRIKRILDIPEAQRVIEEQDIARLHESGWLEDAVEFLAVL